MSPPWRAWPRRIAISVAMWFVACGAALFLGMRPQPVLMATLVAAAATVLLLCVDASAAAASNRWTVVDSDPTRPPGEDPRLAHLTRMVGSHLVSHRPGDQLHRQLVHLIDQRLVARHGVSVHADPGQVAGLVGPELAALVAQEPPYPRLELDQIDVLIARIEEL